VDCPTLVVRLVDSFGHSSNGVAVVVAGDGSES
jgi:hypothetical protein